MVSFDSLKSEYERNWANLEIRPSRLADANAIARKAIKGKATYQQIERLTGVPWHFAALCHYRESNFDFDTYLGNGESLHRVTSLVPKGRGPFATFVDGAVDAFRIENFVGTQDWGIARTLFRLECFNGLGYHAKGCNSPYLYGGSTLYGPPEARAGKFVADHVFDASHVDSQLGTAVILHAIMTLDSSITFEGSPAMAIRSEPDDDMASTILLMQQTLNKLGANPPLDEDGISGPKTKAAVSQFQQRNGLQDTGLLDGTTIAAVTRATAQPIQMPTVDLSKILGRLENLAQLLQPGATPTGTTPIATPPAGTTLAGQSIQLPQILNQLQSLTQALQPGATTSVSTTPAANTTVGVLGQLLSLITKTVPGTPAATNPAPAGQLKQVVDLLSALLSNKPVLGQVNGALGDTIGNLLNGKKTALGIGGSLITALLSAVTASPNAGGLAGLFGTIASAVPGLSQFALPISLALTAWGVLGKMEKWAQGTAPPPKPTS
ncbi:lysozyme family protein/peptidoglycan hydrolase-like protein with peptidoglycan-binding domain [Bradyrhizobium sp. F1.4.3]|uniref:peptidoglycan-binding protein n=1 Tax=Bradyrhizobium sp. F1.4.3 TaxID=3156356 RepID=UPI003398774C